MSRRSRRERAQSLVEFALILPILLLIFMGILDFGRAIYAYNSVSNAAREGARLGIVDQGQTAGVYHAATEAANQATALGLNPANPAQVLVTFPDVDPSHNCSVISAGCPISVRVQYQFTPITPIIGRVLGPFTVGSTTELPVERVQP